MTDASDRPSVAPSIGSVLIDNSDGSGMRVGSIGFQTGGGMGSRPPRCSDGWTDFGETCDDGNHVDRDTCPAGGM